MVHQHFMLIPVFTVAENVMLGHEDTRGPAASAGSTGGRARRKVAEVSKRYGLAVPPDALVADLPVGVQQRVEILKALARDAKVLVLDEPTAVLTPSGDRRPHHASCASCATRARRSCSSPTS